jgi:hypothetical protein
MLLSKVGVKVAYDSGLDGIGKWDNDPIHNQIQTAKDSR